MRKAVLSVYLLIPFFVHSFPHKRSFEAGSEFVKKAGSKTTIANIATQERQYYIHLAQKCSACPLRVCRVSGMGQEDASDGRLGQESVSNIVEEYSVQGRVCVRCLAPEVEKTKASTVVYNEYVKIEAMASGKELRIDFDFDFSSSEFKGLCEVFFYAQRSKKLRDQLPEDQRHNAMRKDICRFVAMLHHKPHTATIQKYIWPVAARMAQETSCEGHATQEYLVENPSSWSLYIANQLRKRGKNKIPVIIVNQLQAGDEVAHCGIDSLYFLVNEEQAAFLQQEPCAHSIAESLVLHEYAHAVVGPLPYFLAIALGFSEKETEILCAYAEAAADRKAYTALARKCFQCPMQACIGMRRDEEDDSRGYLGLRRVRDLTERYGTSNRLCKVCQKKVID